MFHDVIMGTIGRIGREAAKGIGAVGGFLGDVVGGAYESFSDPGFQLPTGGIGRKLGGLVGEAGEVLISRGTPIVMDPGPWGGGSRLPPTVPGPMGSGYPLPVPQVPRGGGTMPTGIPIPFEYGPRYETTEYDPGRGTPGFLPGTEAQYEMATPVALPGGALIGSLLRNIPGVAGGAVLGYQAGQGQSLDLPYGGRIFRQTAAGIRARSLVEVVNPITGKKSWYRNVGRPILFSGDLRACKRVRRIASRARRARGR